ncbi:MAG: helix-turn-helix transcriptional regulator [Saprospiraceae bacterium]
MHDTTIHRIKAIRKQKNMQQQEVAERLNISQSAYAKIENGQSKVDTDRLLQLADIFEVPYDSLPKVKITAISAITKSPMPPASWSISTLPPKKLMSSISLN